MEIRKDDQGKWIYPQYDNYLSNSSATDDKERVIVKNVYIPLEESNDDWIEITSADVERIRKAKGQQIEVEYLKNLTRLQTLLKTVINKVELIDSESLQFITLYPQWSEFIGKSLSTGFKVQYDNKLYKVRQDISVVLENQCPSIDTAALYEEVNEIEAGGNAGTYEDPIPYNNNMALENGKYYSQNGVIYLCNRDTEIPVYQDLSALIDIYVKVATNE